MPDYLYHVAGNTSKFDKYIASIDPSQAGSNCFEIAEANTSSQRSLVASIPTKYLKIVNSLAAEMTQAEKDAVDAALAAENVTTVRTGAKNKIVGFAIDQVILRALADVIKDEINIMRQRDRDRSADVAAAVSLADLKTRWALRSSLDDRTLAQLKTAINNKIDSGSVDS